MFEGVKARGFVDYMLRTLQQSQLHMIVLADHKASIVLSLALVILTLSATKLGLDGLDNQPFIFLLLGGDLVSGLFAVVALVPTLSKASEHRLTHGDSNPLFFGEIGDLSANAYLERIAKVIETDAGVYQAIAADVHATARMLKRKFRWLRYSYLALLTTMVGSTAIALALHATPEGP